MSLSTPRYFARFARTSGWMWPSVALIVLVSAAGCTERAAPSPPSMHFEVRDSLLSDPVEVASGAIRLRPPRGWAPIEGAQMDTLQERLPAPGEAIALQPLRVFFDAEREGLLAVSTLRIDHGDTFESRATYYRTLLESRFASAQAAEFVSGDLHFFQVLTQPEGRVHFRLILDTGRPDLMQFDYVVPQTQYPNAMRSIESSIGSIERTDS